MISKITSFALLAVCHNVLALPNVLAPADAERILSTDEGKIIDKTSHGKAHDGAVAFADYWASYPSAAARISTTAHSMS